MDPVLQRKENRKNGRLLNHGFPVSSEEISKILEMYLGSSDEDDLELYFQRPKITIKKIINDSKSDPGSTELPKTQKKVIDLPVLINSSPINIGNLPPPAIIPIFDI